MQAHVQNVTYHGGQRNTLGQFQPIYWCMWGVKFGIYFRISSHFLLPLFSFFLSSTKQPPTASPNTQAGRSRSRELEYQLHFYFILFSAPPTWSAEMANGKVTKRTRKR